LQDSSEIKVTSSGVEIWVKPGAFGGTCTPVTGGTTTSWGNCFKTAITAQAGVIPAKDADFATTGVTTANSSAMAALVD
jgi:hypothetical protein